MPVERENSVDRGPPRGFGRRRSAPICASRDTGKADATWRREESADALAIVFQIKKGMRYYVAEPVAVERQPAAIAGRRAADDDRAQARRPLPGIGPVDGASAAITELYRQRGFVSATVKYSVVETDPRRPDEGLISRSIVDLRRPPHARRYGPDHRQLRRSRKPELRPLIKLDGRAAVLSAASSTPTATR